jgi:curli biogenesis system outer membrane secretion channel CsgG
MPVNKLLSAVIVAFVLLEMFSHASSAQRKKQVAVLGFDFIAADHQRAAQFAYGDPRNLSKTIASSLENHLVQQGNYVVIERTRIDRILYEQNLGATGRLDASTAAQIGKLMGADEVIYGSVTMLEMEGMPQGQRNNGTWNPRNLKSRIGVHFRMVDTTSGQLKVAEEVIGVSSRAATGEKPKSGSGSFMKDVGIGILASKSASDGPKPEQVGEVIRLAVNDSISIMARKMGESAMQPEAALAGNAPVINGEVLSVNGPTVVIIGIDNSKIKVGDRLDVRRAMSKTSASGKTFTYTDKIGEVEVVEIQPQVVRGSFFGSTPTKEGDLVTNTVNIDPSKLKSAAPAESKTATPVSQPPPASKLPGITGEILSANGSSVVIGGINKSQVKVGDRLDVRRITSRKSLTSQEPIFTDHKIGEVEIIEIESEVVRGSFSGSSLAREGDFITNTKKVDVSRAGRGLSPGNEKSKSKPALSERIPNNLASGSTNVVERYPSIECPDVVSVAQEFAVQVFLLSASQGTLTVVKQGSATSQGGIALPLPAQPDNVPWKIQVILLAPDFNFPDGRNEATIELPLSGDSTPAPFRLRAKPIQGEAKNVEISATLWHNKSRFLGRIARYITINRGDDKVKPETEKQGNPSSGSRLAPGSQRAERLQESGYVPDGEPLKLDFRSVPPDLTIYIGEKFRADLPAEVLIQSPHLKEGSASTFNISLDKLEWLYEQYGNFAQYKHHDLQAEMLGAGQNKPAVKGIKGKKPGPDDNNHDFEWVKLPSVKNPNRTILSMHGVGRELYEKFAPPAFKEAFWELADKLGSNFKTIQIISDNPTIPWELMIPTRDDGSGERSSFLGLEFSIGRWHLPQGARLLNSPPQSLSLERVAAVAPKYPKALIHQTDELVSLSRLSIYQPVPGSFNALESLFAKPPRGIIHFAGRGVMIPAGAKVNDCAIELEGGPLNVPTWRKMVKNKMATNPLLFFNARYVGQTQGVANFVNGWAPAALESGASGYVGTLWSINNPGASEFAARFYEILGSEIKRGPVAVADALRRTRVVFLEKGDLTFLAYVYYGDPNLKFYER